MEFTFTTKVMAHDIVWVDAPEPINESDQHFTGDFLIIWRGIFDMQEACIGATSVIIDRVIGTLWSYTEDGQESIRVNIESSNDWVTTEVRMKPQALSVPLHPRELSINFKSNNLIINFVNYNDYENQM